MILSEHPHDLFGLAGLGERREVPQIAEDDHDLTTMALQKTLVADDQVGQLGRQEPAESAGPLEFLQLLRDPTLELGIPLRQFVGLSADGVVIALDPCQRPHAGQQLRLVDGLHDEVVRSSLEGDDPLLVSAGRDHHDGKELGGGRGADPPTHLVPVHAGHQDVEQDDVDVLGLEQRQRLGSR